MFVERRKVASLLLLHRTLSSYGPMALDSDEELSLGTSSLRRRPRNSRVYRDVSCGSSEPNFILVVGDSVEKVFLPRIWTSSSRGVPSGQMPRCREISHLSRKGARGGWTQHGACSTRRSQRASGLNMIYYNERSRFHPLFSLTIQIFNKFKGLYAPNFGAKQYSFTG